MSARALPKTIPELLQSSAERFGANEAVVDGQVRLTYSELAERCTSFAAALVERGIEVGDRIGIWAFNSAQWIISALGLWQAGAVLVPVNTRFKGQEAAEILSRSRARALVTVTDFLGTDYSRMLREVAPELPALENVVVASGDVPGGAVAFDEMLERGSGAGAGAAARDEVVRRARDLGPDDPSDILFTSGTTGTPKGVVQTHGRTLLVATDWVAMTGLSAGERYLMVNPYFHMFGLKAGILASVAAGATMLPEAVFDVERVLARVEDEKVNVLPGPPTLYQSILDEPARAEHDLSSLRVAVTGAADIPVELVRRVREELPFSLVVTGYGLTEAGTASATSAEDDAETVATTVGRMRPGFELRIVDGHDNDLEPGSAGEILLRGGSVMDAYLDDPDATTQAFTGEGWLRTGDLGVVDGSGCLRIVGRSKDMFIVGGFNVYPAEVENSLLGHPRVGQVAVVGVPDDRLGEVGMAFVVPRSGVAPEIPELIEWARERMANYKVPRFVEVLDELPLNATGKVRKEDLRSRAEARTRRSGR